MTTNNTNISTDDSKNSVSQNKISRPNSLKYDELRENNSHDLKKEMITRIITPSFYAFILVFIVLISGIVSLFRVDYSKAVDFWKLIIPVLTTYLGYAIGKGSSKSGQS